MLEIRRLTISVLGQQKATVGGKGTAPLRVYQVIAGAVEGAILGLRITVGFSLGEATGT